MERRRLGRGLEVSGEGLRCTETRSSASITAIHEAQSSRVSVPSCGADVAPFLGAKRRTWLLDNVAALDVAPSGKDLAVLEVAVPRSGVGGECHHEVGVRSLND